MLSVGIGVSCCTQVIILGILAGEERRVRAYVMPFGKYKGQTLDEIDDEYLEWLLDEDFVREPLRSQLRREGQRRCESRPPPPREVVREVVTVPAKLRTAVGEIITSGYRT
jgi:hypothetical protein